MLPCLLSPRPTSQMASISRRRSSSSSPMSSTTEHSPSSKVQASVATTPVAHTSGKQWASSAWRRTNEGCPLTKQGDSANPVNRFQDYITRKTK